MHDDNHLLIYDLPASQGRVVAFSTTREGGCSTGAYASLNCTAYTGDNPACVERNQQLLRDMLPYPPQELVIPYQTHGTSCLTIDEILTLQPSKSRRCCKGWML